MIVVSDNSIRSSCIISMWLAVIGLIFCAINDYTQVEFEGKIFW